MKDLYHNIAVQQALKPAVATATQTSAAIDRQGYESVTIVFAVGLSGDTLSGSVYWTLTLEESDNDSVYTTVAAADLLNGAGSYVIDSASEDEMAYTFGYKGSKRYLKAVATKTGTHTNGTPLGIIAMKGHPVLAPAA